MKFVYEWLDRWRTRDRAPWSDRLIRLKALPEECFDARGQGVVSRPTGSNAEP